MRHPYAAMPTRRVGHLALRSSLACAIAASLTSFTALAQESPATAESTPAQESAETAPPAADVTTLDQVQVTGVRGSIQSSINKKRDDNVISDVLSAEDIGDLPAPSLADAIETLTGASSTRDKSGASEISIRGLGAFLSTTNFNGREISNGSGDRSVNFNMFPAELINTVAIYKTQRADLIEGGVAGTIGLETVKPLDYGKRAVQLDGRGTYAEYDSKMNDSFGVGWRGTASYIDQFDMGDAGRLGVSIGLQALDGTDPEEGLTSGSTWYACDGTQSNFTGNCREVSAADASSGTPYYLVPSSRTYRVKEERDQRQSQFAALQWKPNDLLEVNLDYQHTDRQWSEKRSDLTLSAGRRAINDRVVDENGVIRSYSGSTSLDSTSTLYERDEEYTGGGLNLIFRPSEAWEISADLSYSHTLRVDTQRSVRLRASGTDIYGNSVPGISGGNTGYVDYDYDYHGDVPSIYLDSDFDLNNWSAFSDDVRVTSEEETNEHTIRAGRFDVSFFPADGFFTKLKAGGRVAESTYRYTDYTVTTDITDSDLIRQANESCRTSFPQEDFLDSASGNTIDSWATFDAACLYSTLTGSMSTGIDDSTPDPNNKDVTEKTRALYLMGEFRSELFGLPVSGNFGARWVKTKVRSVGVRSELEAIDNADGTVSLQSTGDYQTELIKAENDKLLPSINATFELRPDLLLRAAAYRAMSRPDISSLGAGRDIDVDSDASYANLEEALSGITATGNPRAEPLMSWNGDLALEWYANPDTLLAAALYYKQFNGGTETALINETYVIDGQSVVVPVEQEITTDQKSSLYGFELTAAHRFSYLPAPFDGLGFKLSYNYADTDYKTEDSRLGAQYDAETDTWSEGIVEAAGISGFSRHVLSASLYWELGKLDMQLIGKYRSQYYQDFVGSTQQQNRYYRDSSNFDLRATYRFNKHLSMSLEAMNLTNQARIADMPISGSFREYVSYGRRVYLGVRYRF